MNDDCKDRRVEYPDWLHPEWIGVAKRLQSSIPKSSENMSVITLHILVDSKGRPKFWLTPQVKTIEPSSRSTELMAILELLKK